jgi:hypothetical protein
MVNNLTKWLITIVMTGIVPVTGIIYWGANNLRGRLCITLMGLLINVVLAYWYSWLDGRPRNCTD